MKVKDKIMERNWQDVKKRYLNNPKIAEEIEKQRPENEFVNQIIRARIEKNMTQAELAQRVDTKQCSISRLENGDYNPSLEFLKKVAEGLDKKLEIRFV